MVSRIFFVWVLAIAMTSSMFAQSAAKPLKVSTSSEGKAAYESLLKLNEELRGSAFLRAEKVKEVEALYRELAALPSLDQKSVEELITLARELNAKRRYPVLDSIMVLLKTEGCDRQVHKEYVNYSLLELEVVYHNFEGDTMLNRLMAFEEAHGAEGDLMFQARLKSAKARIYAYAGRNLESIEFFEESAVLYEELGRMDMVASMRSNIGLVYAEIDLDDRSIPYYRKSLTIYTTMGVGHLIADVSNNLAMSFKNVGQLDSALIYSKLALKNFQEENDRYGEAQVFSTLGNIYLDQKNYRASLAYNDSSLAICEELGLTYGLVVNYTNRANTYYKSGDYGQALRFLKLAKEVWPGELPRDGKLLLNRLYADANYALGNMNEAATYYKSSLEVADSAYDQRMHALMLSMDNSFLEMRADRKISILNESLKTARLQRRIAWLLFLLGAAIVLGVFGALRARQKQYKLEVDLAHRKLKELEMEVEMRQKDDLYNGLKDQFVNKVSKELMYDLKTLKFNLPVEYRGEVEKIQRNLASANITDKVKEIDQKLSNVYEDFEQQLLDEYPDLNPSELKICNLIRMGLSTQEIAKIINRSDKTISNYRSTIRRKMGIDTNVNLAKHLMNR